MTANISKLFLTNPDDLEVFQEVCGSENLSLDKNTLSPKGELERAILHKKISPTSIVKLI